MRILYVSWYFPPTNTIAARRTGKMVKRFIELGATVQVLTSSSELSDIPELNNAIQTVPFYDIDKNINPVDFLRRFKAPAKTIFENNPSLIQNNSIKTSKSKKPYRNNIIWQKMRQVYTYGVLFPDRHVGWGRHLRPALEQAIQNFKPDLIYVSAPPHSQISHVSAVSTKHRIPWVAEFRDLWADEPFPQAPAWRRWIDKKVESRKLKSATAIVTISEPWGEHYRKRYVGKPVHVAMNGFDPEDFNFDLSRTAQLSPAPPSPLKVIYAGALYPGRRDPSPLFKAIQQSDLQPQDIQVAFYSDYNDVVAGLAEKFQIQDYVQLCSPTDYKSILEIQKAGDVLLLLQWTDLRNNGNVPAKVFEQLALRRPILGIGPLNGVPAHLIHTRHAGLVATDATVIQKQLEAWVSQKRTHKYIADLSVETAAGLERDTQFDGLYKFLEKIKSK